MPPFEFEAEPLVGEGKFEISAGTLRHSIRGLRSLRCEIFASCKLHDRDPESDLITLVQEFGNENGPELGANGDVEASSFALRSR